jgi:hypothetical protein
VRPWIAIRAFLAGGLLLAASRVSAGPVGPVLALACAPTRASVAAAIVDRSVWTTRDGGATWARVAVLAEAAVDDPRSQGAPEWLTPSRSVLPLVEPVATAEQHRITAPDLTSSQSDRPVGPEHPVTPSSPWLAVGDDGAWVAATGESVLVGGPDYGVRRRLDLGGVRGLAVDEKGSIWATVEGALLNLGSTGDAAGAVRRFPLVGAGSIATDPDRARVLVPAREGVAVAERSARSEPEIELRRVGQVAAVAIEPGGELVIAARGRISRRTPDGRSADLGPVPGAVARLLVGQGPVVWIRTVAGRWHFGASAPWRVSSAISVAVDAEGQVWIGSPYGVRSPLDSPPAVGPPPTSRPLRHELVGQVTASAARLFDREVGRPPCRRVPFDLLPRVEVVAGFGRGSTREVARPEPDTQTEQRTWLYLEIWLGWSFGPVSPADCATRLEHHAELVVERRNRTAGLVAAWQSAADRRSAAGDLAAALDARIERDQLAELIRIISGVDPREEEK